MPAGLAPLPEGLPADGRSLRALARPAGAATPEGVRQAAKQFEALFLQMMLKSMREATPGEHVLGGSAEKFYTGMLDQHLGQGLAGRGLGLAEVLQRQLSRQAGMAGDAAGPARPPAAASPAGAGAVPRVPHAQRLGVGTLEGSVVGSAADRSLAAAHPSAAAGLPGAAPSTPAYERTMAAATWGRSALAPAHVERFMSQHLGAAQRASESSGLPAPLILAQAALESGWGRREPRGPGGEPSFNLFGIKADRAWKGASVEAATTEVVDGQTRQVRARFRAYASYDEAFADHARFIAGNPRYAAVRQSGDAMAAADGLQRAGYATDPQYRAKLQQLLRQMS